MSEPAEPNDRAAYIAFEEFRDGLPHGRFRVIVDPDLARQFVARRLNVVPVAIAIVGCGIASALAGHALAGVLLVVCGIVLRRTIKRQAAKILLHLASRQAVTYDAATSQGVMEVRRHQNRH